MKFYKSLIDDYVSAIAAHEENHWAITVIGDGLFLVEIEKSEYDGLKKILQNKPTDPEGYTYKLRSDNLEWELVELPPMEEPELTADEALDIILGGAE